MNRSWPKEVTTVDRFALFPRMVEGKFIWLKFYQSDKVLILNGCGPNHYEFENDRLIK